MTSLRQQKATFIKKNETKKIGNYTYGFDEMLGQGYSGKVYKGKDILTDSPVAIKVINLNELKKRSKAHFDFLNYERHSLKTLIGNHVLNLKEEIKTKNNIYLITELCKTDLGASIKKGLNKMLVQKYFIQILQGYLSIYQGGIIHRDLKPENMLISRNNEIKIADFGFAINHDDQQSSKYNVGTPLYMAPESLKENEYSFKSDIWALGVILFEMCTKKTPWYGETQNSLIKDIQKNNIEQILKRNKIEKKFQDFIIQSLQIDQNKRIGIQQVIRFKSSLEMKLQIQALKSKLVLQDNHKDQNIPHSATIKKIPITTQNTQILTPSIPLHKNKTIRIKKVINWEDPKTDR